MEDIEQLKAQNAALKTEVAVIKDVFEKVAAQKVALEQTCQELLGANINLKASLSIFEKQHTAIVAELNAKIAELEAKLKDKPKKEKA